MANQFAQPEKLSVKRTLTSDELRTILMNVHKHTGKPSLADDPGTSLILGRHSLKHGKTKEALAHFKEAEKSADALPVSTRVRLFNSLAHAKLVDGDNESAIHYSEKTLELLQSDNSSYGKKHLARAYTNIGAADANRGYPETAMNELKKAVELDPSSAIANLNLGISYINNDRPLTAIHRLMRAIELNPNLSHAHYNLGVAYANLQRFDKSLEALNRALELEPNNIAFSKTYDTVLHISMREKSEVGELPAQLSQGNDSDSNLVTVRPGTWIWPPVGAERGEPTGPFLNTEAYRLAFRDSNLP